jgi:pimeloyl-ACP methyl ester carboxylesterase
MGAKYDAGMGTRFESLPMRLRAVSVQKHFGEIPALLVRQDDQPRPFIIWLHGRTADKELDSGRYLRYVRRGINVCAVDLPGHGERFEAELQEPERILEVIQAMVEELDGLVDELGCTGGFDMNKVAIGGMSAGGIVTSIRLLRTHTFKAAVLEASMGSWGAKRDHPMFSGLSKEQFKALNPVENLDGWANIPLIAFHNRHDQWIPYTAQTPFIEALQQRSDEPDLIELVSFDHTGAPHEHMGFGQQSAFVKEVQVEFVARHLRVDQEVTT